MLRAFVSTAFIVALVALPVAAQQPQAAASKTEKKDNSGPYDVDAKVDVMVPMRDGVKLATDLYFPLGHKNNGPEAKPLPERLPVLLIRTPYGKGSGKSGEGKYFASHGYVVVVQDTRGRYNSAGVWRWLSDDGPDGFDCCEWIVKQPWSNGRIGMLGTSYVGGTQHVLALSGSKHLKTVIPVDAVSNMGRQSMRNAGAFEMRFWNWTIMNAANGSAASKDPGTKGVLKQMVDHRHDYLKLLPLRPGTTPLKLAPEYEKWLIDAMRHGADDEFWAAANVVERAKEYADIPVYLVGGWYDSWAGNTTANYQALTKQLKSDVYLIMGPWIHGAQGSSSHGQVNFGPDAAIADPLAWRRAWFDRWLKDDTSTFGTAAPFKSKVRIFVMGTGDGTKDPQGKLNHGGSWRDEAEWPLARAVPTKYYLAGNGSLTAKEHAPVGEPLKFGEVNDLKLSPAAIHSRTEAIFETQYALRSLFTQFRFDPQNPVPTIGGNISSGNDIMLQGAWDQRGGPHVWNWTTPIPLSARNDVVVFQTEPLKDDVEVTGEIEVKLFASSTALDTDFTAKLVDVYPPSAHFPAGFDLNIGDGIVRGRFRKSLKKEEPLEPDEVYPFTIKLYPTSNVFKKGHRIRVDISSSNFPRFDVNPNTFEALADNRRTEPCVNSIYHETEYPSHILLPIVPRAKPAADER
jgi:putative CocE/NonD family hydrolase